MNLWTYRHRFAVGDHPFHVAIKTGAGRMASELRLQDRAVAHDITHVQTAADLRNHRLAHTLPDGRRVEVEAGPVGSWRVGIAVRVDGALVHESHPGQPLRYPDWMRRQMEKAHGATPEEAALHAVRAAQQSAQWDRNKWSLFADLGLGLLFFVVAKFTDLTTAALVGAAAGLALVLVQRHVKVDLLGGLAMFGVVMLLVSAGFSLVFQDDWAVKMKSTILGLLTAALFLSDGALNRGRYFGQRMARYLMQPVDFPRLSLGMGGLGLVMASLNYGVAKWFSTDVWLTYSTFGDTVLVMALFFAVLRFAKPRA